MINWKSLFNDSLKHGQQNLGNDTSTPVFNWYLFPPQENDYLLSLPGRALKSVHETGEIPLSVFPQGAYIEKKNKDRK